YSHASDVQVDVERPTRAQIRQLEREPGIRAVSQVNVYAVIPRRFPDLPIAAQVDGNAGTFVDRARLVRGRRADLNAPEEIDIGESLAARGHFHIGDTIDGESLTGGQLAALGSPGAPAGPHLHLQIVGIERRPLDLGD